MSTYRELIVMVADLAKQVSDDDTLTYKHIAFLLNIYRAYLLKQKYLNKAQEIPQSNYQTVCAKMAYTSTSSLNNCCGNSCYGPSRDFNVLRSEDSVSNLLTFSDTNISLIRCAGKFSIGFDSKLAYPDPNMYGFKTQEEYDKFISYVAEKTYTDELDISSIIESGSDLSKADNPYETSCKEDVNDVISIIVSKYQNVEDALFAVQSTIPQECNPEALYDASMRYYGNVNMVSRERFGYVGIGKYHTRSVYGTIGVDGHLYIKAKEDISIYNKAFVTSIFENPDKAYEQSSCTYKYTDESGEEIIKQCPEGDGICDPWDREFPIEEALQSQLVNLVLRDILGAAYRPKDSVNNSTDDLSDIVAYVRRNMKQQYVNQQNPSNGTAE